MLFCRALSGMEGPCIPESTRPKWIPQELSPPTQQLLNSALHKLDHIVYKRW